MADEPNRGDALLTGSQRGYLRGNYDGGESARYKLRGRMNDRIRHSLLDFALLDTALTDTDREAIFQDIAGADGGEGYVHPASGVETDTVDSLDLVDGLHHALGFIYRTTDDAGIPFDSFLETAIRQSLDMDPSRYEVRAETAVKLLPPEPDVDTAMAKMQNDRPLTDAEFRVLMTEGPFEYENGSHPVIDYYERQQGEKPETVEFTKNDFDVLDELPGEFEGFREWREERAEAFRERREGDGKDDVTAE